MNRIAFLGLACLLICALTPLTTSAQDKTDTKASADTQTTRSNGTVKFFNNSKGFGFISNGAGDQISGEMTARGNGTVKFFNNSKGFGFITNDQGMDVLLEKVAAILGGPTTGCTFEIMDILNDVFSGTYGVGNEVTSNALIRKRPTF